MDRAQLCRGARLQLASCFAVFRKSEPRGQSLSRDVAWHTGRPPRHSSSLLRTLSIIVYRKPQSEIRDAQPALSVCLEVLVVRLDAWQRQGCRYQLYTQIIRPETPRLRPPPKRRGSETECVNAFVGADIQAVLRRYQRLKVTEPTQCFAGHDRLSGIAAERVEPFVAFSAKDPYNRIGMSIRRGGDSGTAAA
jgi:hypothetical protein